MEIEEKKQIMLEKKEEVKKLMKKIDFGAMDWMSNGTLTFYKEYLDDGDDDEITFYIDDKGELKTTIDICYEDLSVEEIVTLYKVVELLGF